LEILNCCIYIQKLGRRFLGKKANAFFAVVFIGSTPCCRQLGYRQAVPPIYNEEKKNLKERQGKWTQDIPAVIEVEQSSWSDVAQMLVRRLRFTAWHPRKVFPTGLTSDEEMERNLGEWRRMNVLYECDGMNVCAFKKTKYIGIMPPNL
jgi:hypothetical protein